MFVYMYECIYDYNIMSIKGNTTASVIGILSWILRGSVADVYIIMCSRILWFGGNWFV